MAIINRNLKGQAAQTSVPSYRIIIEGQELKSKYSVMSIMVHKAVNKIPVAQLIILDGDVSKQDFEASSKGPFEPGKEVTIKLGYQQKEDAVFKGIIVKHGIKVKEGQPTMLVLELKDKAVEMTVNRKNKYFKDKTDSDIIGKIIKDHGLKADVDSTTVTHKEMVQYYCTDWDFIVSRAEANGMLVYVNDGNIEVKKPDTSKTPLGSLAFGYNIYEFEAEMDARDEYSNIVSRAWDYKKQDLVEKKSKPPTLKEEGNLTGKKLSDVTGKKDHELQHTGKLDDGELQAWADAQLMRSRMAKIQGRVKIEGYSVVKMGDTIKLDEFSKKFNGTAFVSEIRHTFSAKSTWYTDIKFGVPKDWLTKKYPDVADVPASGLLPGIRGLHIGIVTKIDGDPDGEDRVKIKVPVIDNKDEGTWARIARLDAGEERGSFFMPELKDEVIVGFLNDDPRSPIILGMVHSSKKKMPLRPEEKNKQKGFFTKSKIKLVFDDDKKSVTIETPGKNSIVIDDDKKSITLSDQNKNKIVMDKDGVTIESAKHITLKAEKGDIVMNANNLKSSFKQKAAIESKGQASVKATGILEVKGSVLKLNC